ncbi:MAG: chemotaxis protein CheW [Spirochaetaceae bacterium]|nr:chemotaxis protein CheW [Spirochaetaceae bacterium]
MAKPKSEHLIFRVDGEAYALSVETVREVVEYGRITSIPLSDPSMRGLINLRGAGVPVVDLRLLLGLWPADATRDTSIIIVDAPAGAGETSLLGAIADSVCEVTSFGALEPAPRFGSRAPLEYIAGICRKGDGFVVVLDAERLFAGLRIEEGVVA